MGSLPAKEAEEITILDMEASIEHLTRGTVCNVDALLVVTEPYYRSLETTGRMVPLAKELGLDRVWVVANKVRVERDEAALREYCVRRNFDIIGFVPYDEQVTEADRHGQALIDHAPTAAAVIEVERIAASILERFAAIPLSVA